MNPDDFRHSPCGRIVPTIDGAWAFVPDPLPPPLGLEPLVPLLAEASMALGELNGIGRTLVNPYLLIRPFQRREAIASSSIEGTVTSLSDLFLFEGGADERARPPDTREVFNYVRALELGIERMNEIPISLRLIREMHEMLLRGLRRHRGGTVPPGEFRKEQNWIGAQAIASARFIPPPPNHVMEELYTLEKFIHSPLNAQIPPLIESAMVHYQFETIHPFPDGNGRVGRLLIPLILHAKGALSQPLLYLSPYFERNYNDYVDKLYNVSKNGVWLEWIEFFLNAVVEQCRDTITRVQKLQDLHSKYRKKVQQVRASALQLQLVDMVFQMLVISVPMAQKSLGVTPRSAALNVQKLVEAEILVDMQLRSRPRFFMAHEVFQIIDAEVA